MTQQLNTRIFIVSDTHGDQLQHTNLAEPVDVAIHCGDLTEESKLDEFKAALVLLKALPAALKLVIAGNHDFTLDTPLFQKKISSAQPPLDPALVRREFGDYDEALDLLQSAKAAGVIFLDEGSHHFDLANGARLKVYASPCTASAGEGGFQYHPKEDHVWNIDSDTDVVITHGPPQGLFDRVDGKRVGSASLFAAVARAKPQLHCFGHIHESWGAKMVTWREEIGDSPSHFTSIDNDRSHVVEDYSGIHRRKFDSPEMIHEKAGRLRTYQANGCCVYDQPPTAGTQTLFVNAAIEGTEDEVQQPPWVVTIGLPLTSA